MKDVVQVKLFGRNLYTIYICTIIISFYSGSKLKTDDTEYMMYSDPEHPPKDKDKAIENKNKAKTHRPKSSKFRERPAASKKERKSSSSSSSSSSSDSSVTSVTSESESDQSNRLV